MPTVRCPSCDRALRLPENREVTTAQCPLCGHTFDAAPAAPPPQRVAAEVRAPRRLDDPASPQQKAARDSLLTAAWWLTAAGSVGVLQLIFCSCVDLSQSEARFAVGLQYVLWLMAARFVALAVIWSAAESLRRQRGLAHSYLGAFLAFAVGAYMVFRAVPSLARVTQVPLASPQATSLDYNANAIFAACCLAVALPCLFGSLLTFLVLGRPSVRALFYPSKSRANSAR